MGYYINKNSKGKQLPDQYQNKINFIEDDGGIIIPTPENWKEGLVCVVDNGWMSAAAYAFSESEMNVFKTNDGRSKTWMYYSQAKKLAK